MAEFVEAPRLPEDEATRLLQEQNDEQVSKLKIDETEGKIEGDGDEDDDDEEEDGNGAQKAGEGGKKKRKKKKKSAKKKTNKDAVGEAGSHPIPPASPPLSRLLGGSTNYFMKYGQTFPPSRPVSELFPSGGFPVGEIQPHGKTKYPDPHSTWARKSEEEKRNDERLLEPTLYEDVRHAAEVHRQVRTYMQSVIQPGIKLADMCALLEDTNRRLVKENGLKAGIAFPTGCSINHVAAHYTPNPGDNTVLEYGDVMKIDFGTQIGGRIIDCAYTVSFDPTFDPLLLAVKEATYTGIKCAGIDMQLGEIGAQIQEVME
eukprot:gene44511-54438_t